jgi:hypothetical protein
MVFNELEDSEADVAKEAAVVCGCMDVEDVSILTYLVRLEVSKEGSKL